ncbi:MAG: UDP-galactopyranose mutase [Candidatus Gottesmanbacteria bacterium GW2011_GWA1_34_13]|uniref:UDP-galactopyranose mutase n=1 Tax=Candidatus Gottesmanbacteria bacterium GW2011_GWA1_34_13 TaxID=1618434 RepID=A0A0G0ASR2_9BACT|nr:MAG: UDP-galactopyranose mutase [Candidatus Gottesmanbacteria bacterium GW2011_GWA1_34_13]
MKKKIKKQILIIGGGYCGCSIARILSDRGFEVKIFEQTSRIGGMAISYYKEGMVFELGPHVIANHASNQLSMEFLKKYIKLNPTVIHSATYIQNKYLNYPPLYQDIKHLKQNHKIFKELLNLPSKPDIKNFETYLISKVGISLYKIYFKSFTKKFWKINPRLLSHKWAKLRHLGSSLSEKQMYFNNKFCSYPKLDFNELFVNLSKNINILFNHKITKIDFKNSTIETSTGQKFTGDLIISTISIDELLRFRFNKLAYRGYSIKPVIIHKSYFHPIDSKTHKHFGIVYYPENNYTHTRITEYKSYNQKHNTPAFINRTLITVETPSKIKKYYPIMNDENEDIFKKNIRLISDYNRVVSLGRLGLYKYMTLDTTTEQIFRFLKYFDKWTEISSREREAAYMIIRGSWDN